MEASHHRETAYYSTEAASRHRFVRLVGIFFVDTALRTYTVDYSNRESLFTPVSFIALASSLAESDESLKIITRLITWRGYGS